MGVVTWKNIAPSNPSGILSAANEAAKTMGEGFSGVGTALQEGVDKKVQSETDQFITDLMAAGSQEERDAMIGEANNAFLNIDTINKTNYELGEPDRVKKAFEEQEATKHLFNIKLENLKRENTIKINKAKPSKPSKSGSMGGNRTAEDTKGILHPTNKLFTKLKEDDEGGLFWLNNLPGFGSDYTERDEQRINKFNNEFLGTYGERISEEDLNTAFNTGLIRWEDAWSTDNDFYFEHQGKTIGLTDENAGELLFEKLMDEKFNEAQRLVDKGYSNINPEKYKTAKAKVRGQYLEEFFKNNPKLETMDREDLFMRIWKDNEKSINKNKFTADSESAKIFKTITDKKDVPLKWEGGLYTGPFSGYNEWSQEAKVLRKKLEKELKK